jgi:hypothetical protein
LSIAGKLLKINSIIQPNRILIHKLPVLFQTTLAGIVEELQEVAVLIGQFSWDADLIAVEVVGLLAAFSVFVSPIM